MSKFDIKYDLAEIYSDFKVFKPDDIDAKIEFNNVTLRVSEITNSRSDFDKICKLCVNSK